jgi:hypothetical protein
MIILYPIGVPSLYLYLLYSCKHEITARNMKRDNNSQSALNIRKQESANQCDEENACHDPTSKSVSVDRPISSQTMRLRFLWKAYQPKYWYWEVIETTRKLMLTAVLSVCSPGSAKQNVLGLILSFGYIRLYGYCAPYDEFAENVLAETGQMQILFTFFVIMMLQQNMLGSDWDTTLGALLTVLNLTIVFLILFYEVVNYRKIVGRKETAASQDAEDEKRLNGRSVFAQNISGFSLDREQISDPTTVGGDHQPSFDDVGSNSDSEEDNREAHVATTVNVMHFKKYPTVGQTEMKVMRSISSTI